MKPNETGRKFKAFSSNSYFPPGNWRVSPMINGFPWHQDANQTKTRSTPPKPYSFHYFNEILSFGSLDHYKFSVKIFIKCEFGPLCLSHVTTLFCGLHLRLVRTSLLISEHSNSACSSGQSLTLLILIIALIASKNGLILKLWQVFTKNCVYTSLPCNISGSGRWRFG